MRRANLTGSSSLARLLGDEADAFFALSYEKEWRHISGRGPSHFSDIFSLEKAEELLWRYESKFRDLVRFHRDGCDIVQPSALGSLDQFSWATDQFRQGTTIIFNTLEDCCPEIGAFVRDLEGVLTARVSAAAYLTPVGSRAFAEHFDTHDVLIAQIDGAKTYTLRKSKHVPSLPHRRQQAEIDRDVEANVPISVTLRPGDVLYIPRGLLHAAEARDRHSVHVTFSLHPVRVGDLATTAIEIAVEKSPDLRRSVNLVGEDSQADAIVGRIASALGVDLPIDHVLTRQRQKAVARLRPLPGQRLALGTVATPLEGADYLEKTPGTVLTIALSQSRLLFAFPGIGVIRDADRTPTRLEVPGSAAEAIRFIDEARNPFRADELPGPLSAKSNSLLLDFLLREGLLQRVKVE